MTEPLMSVNHCRVMAKPSSSRCNLDCHYCFYFEKEKLYPERGTDWWMDESTLELYVRQQIEAQVSGDITFSWQGGEPTLMGVEYFQKAVALQQKYADGRPIQNAFQTNGILINDEWCAFFKQHDFLVGVSIDGPADLHDCYRVNRAGKPTHQRVVQAIERLKAHGVRFNTLTVVNAKNAKSPERVYDFLTSIGSEFIQFIPLVEKQATQPTAEGLTLIHPELKQQAEVTPWSVSSSDYGQFLSKVFDRWLQKDVGRIFVNMFDSVLSAWCGQPNGMCVLSPACGHALALEANGDVYNCDHYVYPEHKLGNIHHQSLKEMNNSAQAIKFGLDKQRKLTGQCQSCEFRFACHGGCPKHRFSTSQTGEALHNYFCEGYRHFFRHSAPTMRLMRDLIARGRAPSEAMFILHRQKAVVSEMAQGRNAPCPCGSGKKFKRCCGR